MPAIGYVNALEDGSFRGTLRTLSVTAALSILPNKTKEPESKQPDYRVLANGAEVGAGWIRQNKGGEEYVSLSLSAPEFGRKRLFANLGRAAGSEADDEFAVIWNPDDRRRRHWPRSQRARLAGAAVPRFGKRSPGDVRGVDPIRQGLREAADLDHPVQSVEGCGSRRGEVAEIREDVRSDMKWENPGPDMPTPGPRERSGRRLRITQLYSSVPPEGGTVRTSLRLDEGSALGDEVLDRLRAVDGRLLGERRELLELSRNDLVLLLGVGGLQLDRLAGRLRADQSLQEVEMGVDVGAGGLDRLAAELLVALARGRIRPRGRRSPPRSRP